MEVTEDTTLVDIVLGLWGIPLYRGDAGMTGLDRVRSEVDSVEATENPKEDIVRDVGEPGGLVAIVETSIEKGAATAEVTILVLVVPCVVRGKRPVVGGCWFGCSM